MDSTISLVSVPLFRDMPDEDRKALASIAGTLEYGRAETVFHEGDPADRFFVVKSGRIKIFKLSADGKEQILHIFGSGEPFGEAPVFSGKRFPASAETLEKSVVHFFPRTAFVDLIKQQPSLALNMMAVLSERLHRFTDMIEQLSLREVPERLASYLLYQSAVRGCTTEIDLDVTKTQLASFLGTIPETLSRVLARMEQQGLVQLSGQRRISLTDREALEALAGSEIRLE